MANSMGTRRPTATVILLALLLLSILSCYSVVSASAIAPPLAARLAAGKRKAQTVAADAPSAVEAQSAAILITPPSESPIQYDNSNNSVGATAKAASSNPIIQLVTYVKDSMVNFKNGLGQMNLDHRRCNDIRTKQRSFAKENGFSRPRGVKGIQTGGITYEGETWILIFVFVLCCAYF